MTITEYTVLIVGIVALYALIRQEIRYRRLHSTQARNRKGQYTNSKATIQTVKRIEATVGTVHKYYEYRDNRRYIR